MENDGICLICENIFDDSPYEICLKCLNKDDDVLGRELDRLEAEADRGVLNEMD